MYNIQYPYIQMYIYIYIIDVPAKGEEGSGVLLVADAGVPEEHTSAYVSIRQHTAYVPAKGEEGGGVLLVADAGVPEEPHYDLLPLRRQHRRFSASVPLDFTIPLPLLYL